MENSVNFAHLESKISLLGSKDVKKQSSLRCHVVSGVLAMVDMLHALRSLWEAVFPFALLWWNVMLCATCARYYSWNRARFRLQCGGQRFHEDRMRESGVEEIGKKSALPFDPSDEVSHVEMEVLTNHPSTSLMQASCVQTVELGSCRLPQSLPSARELNRDMFFHDAHVDGIVLCAKEHHDDQDKEITLEDSTVCSALDVALPAGASKLSFLHLLDESIQQSGLLKEAYWAACPFLLPQQVAPLAMYALSRNFLDMEALIMQLLHNIYIEFPTLEEHMQVFAIKFFSSVLSMVHSKEHAYLAMKIAKYLTSRGCSVHDIIKRLVLSFSFSDLYPTKNILSSEPLGGSIDRFGSGTGKHPFSSHVSGGDLRSDIGHMLTAAEQDVSDDEGSCPSTLSQSYDGCIRGSHSHADSNNFPDDGNAVESRQMDGDIVNAADSLSAVERGKDMGFFHDGGSFQLNENYYFFNDQSADWDVKYGGSHLCQGVDSICGGYYDTGDQVLSSYSCFDGHFECDDTVSGGLKYVDETEGNGNSSEVKKPCPSDTWWDEDAVVVGNQVREEEDSMEQAWQVI